MKPVTACEHKDRKHYAHGLCKRCYYRLKSSGAVFPKKQPPVVTCGHDDVPHQGFGLCQKCYGKRRRKAKIPTCHPDRPYRSKGLCDECYVAQSPTFKAKSKEWVSKNKERLYELQSLKPLGLTLGDYFEMEALQGGRCGICRAGPPSKFKKKRWMVMDHDHSTGLARGLLCSTCNTGLGLLGDSPENLVSAAMYLLGHDADRLYGVVGHVLDRMTALFLIPSRKKQRV